MNIVSKNNESLTTSPVVWIARANSPTWKRENLGEHNSRRNTTLAPRWIWPKSTYFISPVVTYVRRRSCLDADLLYPCVSVVFDI